MKRATLALVLCACASKGPIPTGDRPAWVSTPNGDVRFPSDRFIAQVGSTAVGAKPAPELLASVDAAAKAAVASTLTSAIAAESRNFETNGATPEQLAADLLAGIEIQGRWRAGDTAYGWAILDKSKALAAQQAAVADHEKLARELLAQGAAVEREKPADALRAYARARGEAAA